MTQEQAQEVLDELQGVRPEILKGEAKRLFKAIMKIADGRDELYKKVQEQNKIIDLMAEMIDSFDIDEIICKQISQKMQNCNEYEKKEVCLKCIKEYFENKVKESKYEK